MNRHKLQLIAGTLALFCVFTAISFGQANEKYTKYTHEILPNGLDLIIGYNPDSRVFAINILGKNRAANEPASQEGITDFVNRMLVSGADGMTAEEIQNKLDDIGAALTTNDNPYIPYDDRYTSRSFSFIKFETIDEYAADGTKLLYRIVAKPTFPEDEIAQTRKKVMGILGMSSGSTYQTCRDLFYKTLFYGHPFSRPVLGSQRSVGSFTRDNLVSYHKHFYAPNNMIMAVVSNIAPDTIMTWIKATFGKMAKDKSSYVEIPVPAKPEGVTEVHEEMDKEQVYIYMGTTIPGLKSPDAPAINMGAAILSSHMGLELREKQGLAYSVGADVDFMPEFGWLVASMGTGYQNADVATGGMISEINAMITNEPTQEELSKVQNSTWGSMLLARASRINQAFYMCRNEFLGVGYNYENDYLTKIRQVTTADIKRVAREYFDAYDIVIATAGKKAEPK
jgi:predicted Zn-dependent peptidase